MCFRNVFEKNPLRRIFLLIMICWNNQKNDGRITMKQEENDAQESLADKPRTQKRRRNVAVSPAGGGGAFSYDKAIIGVDGDGSTNFSPCLIPVLACLILASIAKSE